VSRLSREVAEQNEASNPEAQQPIPASPGPREKQEWQEDVFAQGEYASARPPGQGVAGTTEQESVPPLSPIPAALGTPSPLSPGDVIDQRIDVCAQFALLRMNRADAAARADAAGMLGAIKTGQLAGILNHTTLAAVQLARRHRVTRFNLVPQGEDAALVLDPDAPMVKPPSIVFRGVETKPGEKVPCPPPERIDPALRKAWATFLLWKSGKLNRCDLAQPGAPATFVGTAEATPSDCLPPPNLFPPILGQFPPSRTPAPPKLPGGLFSVFLDPKPLGLIPVYRAEATATGTDLFGANTRRVCLTNDPSEANTRRACRTGNEKEDKAKEKKECLLFIPGAIHPERNQVHVCWSPGDATSEALTGAFRFALNSVGWILIVVEGPDRPDGFVTLSAAEIVEILRKAGRPARIDALRLSGHSRGALGLAETLNQDLLVQRKGAAAYPKVGPEVVERVVNFDNYFFSFLKAMDASGIPSSKIFGYRVVIPSIGKPAENFWSASKSQTIDLLPVLNGVRAVGYSRLIQDAIKIGRRTLTPPDSLTLADITGRLLTNLPALGDFTSRSSDHTEFRQFCRINAPAIANCLRDEQHSDLDHAFKGPLIEFVNNNNLAGIGRFSAAIWAHQLFACEFAHEVTDGADPQP
jgi:hypothetical protein